MFSVKHNQSKSRKRTAMNKLICLTSVLFGFAILLMSGDAARGDSLNNIRNRYNLNLDTARISVSGVSAGGWIANQFHMAYSEMVMGAGILAAGPYHCAGNPTLDLCMFQPFMLHDTCEAAYSCSSLMRAASGNPDQYIGPPRLEPSIHSTLVEASNGNIAPLATLRGDRVWLFSGTKDRLVPTVVVQLLQQYYIDLFRRPEVNNPVSNIYFQINANGREAEHSMVVDNPDDPNKCDHFGEPFINDCGYDAAGEILKFIYAAGPALVQPERGVWDRDGLMEFDQTAFFDATDASISMNDLAHVFVPRACQQGAQCPLHIAFHGCDMHQQLVRQQCGDGEPKCPAYYFFSDAGYNEWADKNGIVVLYPQNTSWGDPQNVFDADKNPHGCWDWWGYSGIDYFRRSAKQMTAVKKMVDCLTGSASCP